MSMHSRIFTQYPHRAHVSPLKEDYEEIDWKQPTVDDYRIKDHTCNCERYGTFYEFCSSGGLVHILKIYRSRDVKKNSCLQSDRWLTAYGEEMWRRLLRGEAI